MSSPINELPTIWRRQVAVEPAADIYNPLPSQLPRHRHGRAVGLQWETISVQISDFVQIHVEVEEPETS